MIKLIKADDRLKAVPKINIALFGPSGVGKTTLARTLDPETTLFVDLEGGTLAIQGWAGDVLDVRGIAQQLNKYPWEIARALALYIGGFDPSDKDGAYSKPVYEAVSKAFAAIDLNKYKTIFVDSITVASRECFKWSQVQPEAIAANGKPDTRGAYGILGREMIRWLTHLQHASKSVIVVGILDQDIDDLKRISWTPQVEGSKTGRELPGIFDQVITLQTFKTEEGQAFRGLVCQQVNPWGYPAKDRSGRLQMMEPPHLGDLMKKIREGERIDTNIVTTMPKDAASAK
jgi:AAA domain